MCIFTENKNITLVYDVLTVADTKTIKVFKGTRCESLQNPQVAGIIHV